MDIPHLGPEDQDIVEQVLGYLNFSSGAEDLQFLKGINRIFQIVKDYPEDRRQGLKKSNKLTSEDLPDWKFVGIILLEHLKELQSRSTAFRDIEQAASVVDLVINSVLPGYMEYHQDLLFHQSSEYLFQSFFWGRASEVVLLSGPPWDRPEKIVKDSINRLNDYIGFRPCATLQTHKHEPYEHEWSRPIPLYIRGVGVADSRYREVIQHALKMLEQAAPAIQRQAFYDPDCLDELSVDARAYDFEHPVNKRPNYHFGQWDPHHIDNSGYYRRFVIQQVTLDALMVRVEQSSELPVEELVIEAAAVLAGTILMAAGISGDRPDAHDSTTSLFSLLPQIAAYRDAFYQDLIQKLEGLHAERLREEASRLRQPFGEARQHLNAQLTRQRASQLEHVRLAKVFANMGYPDAATRQSNIVPVASSRMLCQIECCLTAGRQSISAQTLDVALGALQKVADLLRRAIECGAVVDPWNILGFDAHFSLFPALENSVHDHRVDDLLELIEDYFSLYSLVWSEAAARDDQVICQKISADFQESANWWHQFAAHEVTSVEFINPLEEFHAAQHVAKALNLWHKAGADAGNIAFWAPHVEMFDSPKAYVLVVNTLLDRGDRVAALALLVHWLSRAEEVPLQHGNSSFFRLAHRWLFQLKASPNAEVSAIEGSATVSDSDETWRLTTKLFDYFEANAEDYWQAPLFELGQERKSKKSKRLENQEGSIEETEEDDLFSAAYEQVVYRDSTDDGFDGSVFDSDQSSRDELEKESRRIIRRLDFLICLARLWKVAVGHFVTSFNKTEEHRKVMIRWASQTSFFQINLLDLLDCVEEYQITLSGNDQEVLRDFDRRLTIKDLLLERIVTTCLEMSDADILLRSASGKFKEGRKNTTSLEELGPDNYQAVDVLNAIISRDIAQVRLTFEEYIQALQDQRLLYIPINKGGDARSVVSTRFRQLQIKKILSCLPRLGLYSETRKLIETTRLLERDNIVGPGAVTEYNELFEIGYKSIVESFIASDDEFKKKIESKVKRPESPDSALVACLELMTQSMIENWLAHSRTLRLSVLEQIKEDKKWNKIVGFIKKYGSDIFTQRFLQIGNLRAILHQGVNNWLSNLEEGNHSEFSIKLIDELGGPLSKRTAVNSLTIIFETVVENYREYRDYNATTTQSDRGDLLYYFIDFLRLRMDYERVVWNLKPVVLAHRILVRCGRIQAAEQWRRALMERFQDEAEQFLVRLDKLQDKYAMSLPTVADRLAERFVLPMTIDRIQALVKPAIHEANQAGCNASFDLLEKETSMLVQDPTGVGFDAPGWLVALEDEVQNVRLSGHEKEGFDELAEYLNREFLTLDEIQDELEEWISEE